MYAGGVFTFQNMNNNIVFGVEVDYLFNVRFFIHGKKSVIVVFVASGVDER